MNSGSARELHVQSVRRSEISSTRLSMPKSLRDSASQGGLAVREIGRLLTLRGLMSLNLHVAGLSIRKVKSPRTLRGLDDASGSPLGSPWATLMRDRRGSASQPRYLSTKEPRVVTMHPS